MNPPAKPVPTDRDLERRVKQKLVTKHEAQRYMRNPTQLDKPREPPAPTR